MGSATLQAPFVAVRRGSLFFPTFDSSHAVRSVKCSALVSKSETGNDKKKGFSKGGGKQAKRVKAVAQDTSVSSTADALPDLNYDEVAETLENIFKSSPAAEVLDLERENEEKEEEQNGDLNLGGMRLVRGKRRKMRRMSVEKRVELKKARDEERMKEDSFEDQLLMESTTNLGNGNVNSLDWKRMKIPPVLKLAEHTKLFKLMQPMKAINEMKEKMQSDMQREPKDAEIAAKMNMNMRQLRRHIDVGQAARNKLIKHNLRLVLYVMNKYFAEYASSEKFDDMCQAGVKGLITAIDRFQTKKGFRLSTYGLFWIRHSIIRSMTTSSFMQYPFAFESAKHLIQKARLNLLLELGRPPTDDEIAKRVKMSKERYHDVLKASRPIYSLNAKHPVTQEELIDMLSEDRCNKEPAVLRLALDDVLDSLKPKESIVIRQRFGLDGKGERSLSEIAGNLNISKEMVRKHELKAFMKLRHPTRLDYLRKFL
ncbi:hypothetical protein LUZ60_008348 [Juncus effusus]|nr:hypothetical protein LUZ60_008348 [Juncus effusus]